MQMNKPICMTRIVLIVVVIFCFIGVATAQREGLTVDSNRMVAATTNPNTVVNGNQSVSISGSRNLNIGSDDQQTVGRSRTINVGGLDSTSVSGEQRLTVGTTQTVRINRDINVTSGGNKTEQTAGVATYRSGQSIVIEANDELILRVGDSMIRMRKNGDITISGKNINILGTGKIITKDSSGVK
jgi:type VI secretion system secreted protein VgrG